MRFLQRNLQSLASFPCILKDLQSQKNKASSLCPGEKAEPTCLLVLDAHIGVRGLIFLPAEQRKNAGRWMKKERETTGLARMGRSALGLLIDCTLGLNPRASDIMAKIISQKI